MYERDYGYRYEEAEGSATDIAKLIRRDIKQAVAEGLLPAHWKYSVRTRYASMMQAIDVDVKDCADGWKDCDKVPCRNPWCAFGGEHRDSPSATHHQVLTDDADAAKMTLERIHSAYNHDGSDSQVDYFDVRYYGHVSFQDAGSADFERREKERKAAKRTALDEATDRRVIRVYGRAGSTTHLAAKVDGRVRLLCGATLWRSSVVSFTEGREITCSRCAKKLEPAS